MNKKKTPRTYREFIHNEEFIIWILTEDNTQDEFWNNYIKQNPDLKDEFQRAIITCRKIKSKGDHLDEIQRDSFLLLIKQSSLAIVRKKKVRLIRAYAAAACTLLIISLSALFLGKQDELRNRDFLFSLLDSTSNNVENIHIISGTNQRLIKTEESLVQTQEGDILVGENNKIKSADLKSEYITLVVPKGKRSKIKFSDGSVAWINSGSKVIYPKVFEHKTRDIILDGEIFIDVAQMNGIPFLVHTKEMDIKVLGTQFNVNAYSEETTKSIVLVSGSVEVKHNKNKSKLSPNQGLFTESGIIHIKEVDIHKYICWKEGILQLEDEPFSVLLRKLSRYYGVQIHADPDLDNFRFEGNLSLKDSLGDVLQALSLSKHFKTKQENNAIYISR